MTDRNEAPVIVSGGGGGSASLSVAENLGLVTTIAADDPDAVDSPRSFSIVGGADAGLFAIQAETGQLYLAVAGRDFEAPADSDGDHVYEVIVAVSDGVEPADTQALSVTVTDSNEAPVITSNGGGSSVALTYRRGHQPGRDRRRRRPGRVDARLFDHGRQRRRPLHRRFGDRRGALRSGARLRDPARCP